MKFKSLLITAKSIRQLLFSCILMMLSTLANAQSANIVFADTYVKTICVTNWDTSGDGELSYDEAAIVTGLGGLFANDSQINSFEELQYFTGLTNIASAFYGSGLTAVSIPSSVTSIGNNAFGDCEYLTTVSIPNSVTRIEVHAFQGCKSLTSITLPNSVETIGEGAFYNCTGMTSFTIPNSVTSIDAEAF